MLILRVGRYFWELKAATHNWEDWMICKERLRRQGMPFLTGEKGCFMRWVEVVPIAMQSSRGR
jgi:hypothetical protein